MAGKLWLIVAPLAFWPLAGCAERARGSEAVSEIRYPPAATLVPRPVLLRRGSTTVYNGGYGSSLSRHPSDTTLYYLLTDRGPNYEMPAEDHKTFPLPTYHPKIGLFRLRDTTLVLEKTIELKSGSGAGLSGIPNPSGRGGTGEVPLDSLGATLPFDSLGIDSEGLAVMADGTFWVSDEYGPGLLHVDADGKTMERINPFTPGRALPAVFMSRRPNRGIEGLAVTPDQRFLVAMLETPLDNPKAAGRASRITRILVLDLQTGQFRQFAYVLEKSGVTNNGITALSENQLLVLERDDKFPGDSADPSTFKRVYRVDLSGATDLSDPANGVAGRLFNGKTVEELTVEELAAAGLAAVTKSLVVDLLAPELAYPHNKPEGIAVIDRQTIAVSNDDDFGITDDGSGGIFPKVLPLTGQPDETTVRFIRVSQPLY
jgi:Esterase-like activity of phytase